MPVKVISVFCLWLVAGALSAQKNVVYSEPPVKPIVIDGHSADWNEPFRWYDGASKLQFSFCNDSANLYCCIKSNDEEAQEKMLHAGIELSIEAGKKSTALINFPTPWLRGKSALPDVGPGVKNQNVMKGKMAAEVNLMKLKGFSTIPDGIYPINGKEGLYVAFAMDSLNELTVEYRIPYKLLFEKTDTTKLYTAGILLKGIERPAGNHMNSAAMQSPTNNNDIEDNNIGTMNGNMRGGQYGGMGNPQTTAPPPGYMSGPVNTLIQDNNVKLKLKLAGW